MKWNESRLVVSDFCSPVDWILQARLLEWVAILFSRGSSQSRDQTRMSWIAGGFFISWATRDAPKEYILYNSLVLVGVTCNSIYVTLRADKLTHGDRKENAAAAKSLQSCPTLCNPKESSPPHSSVHRILYARILEWVAISFSKKWDYDCLFGNGNWLKKDIKEFSRGNEIVL